MWNTFKYTLLALLREKHILIWALAFPLILATLFNLMFAGIDKAYSFDPIPVAVVKSQDLSRAPGFTQMIDTLSKKGDDRLLKTRFVSDEKTARSLLADQSIVGYMTVGQSGVPALHLTNSSTTDDVQQTILKNIADNYTRSSSMVETLAKKNPAALSDPATLQSLYDQGTYTKMISVTSNTASGSVRYFYALLGFAAIMSAMIGMTAISRTQPNLSALGARRSLGGTSRTKTLFATFGAAWLLSFLGLTAAFFYMRFVLGVGFGGKDIACVFAIFVASFMTTSLGTLIGSIPKLPESAKAGMLTGISCLLGLISGLYGEAVQKLADQISRTAPLVQMMNPSKQVADLFYSLYYYDTYVQYEHALLVLVALAAVFLVGASILMRRQRYASL